MRIETSKPKLLDDGDFPVLVSKGYGDPHGDLSLDGGKWELCLTHLLPEDCDRLIRAAAEIKERVLAYQAELAVPHGRRHLHKGTCQLCGKPEDDELHAETTKSEYPFDVGEGSRELGSPGRELLAAATAEQDAADEAASVTA